MNWILVVQDNLVASCCEHDNETSGFAKTQGIALLTERKLFSEEEL
jgi:hypothetical protein